MSQNIKNKMKKNISQFFVTRVTKVRQTPKVGNSGADI